MFALKRLPQRNILVRNAPVPKPVSKLVPVKSTPPSQYISMKVLMLTQVKSCRACNRK